MYWDELSVAYALCFNLQDLKCDGYHSVWNYTVELST